MKRLLLCAALIAWSGMASAVVYKWIDGHGKVQYGDRPPDGVHAEVVEILGTHIARTGPAAAAANTAPAASQGPAAAPPANAPGGPQPRSPAGSKASDKQAVAEDVAQVRAKQCSDAQDRYKRLIEGRKLYTTSTDGERQYLTSDQIDSERLSAKSDIDSICNSPT